VGPRGHSKNRGLQFFSVEEETKIINWEEDVCTPKNNIAVKRVDFISDRRSYTRSSERSLV